MERQYAYGAGIDDVLVLFAKDGATYDVFYLKDPLWTGEAEVPTLPVRHGPLGYQ